jgi:hypothetical protein
VQAVAFYVFIKSAFVGKQALNLSKCTAKQQLKKPKYGFVHRINRINKNGGCSKILNKICF